MTATQFVFPRAGVFVVGVLMLGSLLAPAVVRAQSDPSLFTTVINSPPDVAPPLLGSDTQLNVIANGVHEPITISPGATNIEVNVMGGSVDSIDLGHGNGSVINRHGGYIGIADADLINIYGGSSTNIGGGSSQFLGGDVYNLYGGDVQIVLGSGPDSVINLIGTETSVVNLQSGPSPLPPGAAGPTLNMTGGAIINIFEISANSTANVSGGVLPAFSGIGLAGGGELNLIVTQLAIEGSNVNLPLSVRMPILNANTGPNMVTSNLSGVLADGTPFAVDLRYFGGSSRITATLVPEPSTVIATSLAFAMLVLRRGRLSRGAA